MIIVIKWQAVLRTQTLTTCKHSIILSSYKLCEFPTITKTEV